MQRFFMKKYIFSVLFLVVLYGFAGVNFLHQRGDLKDTISKNLQVKTEKEVREAIFDLEKTINRNILGRMQFVEFYGELHRILGKKEIKNFSYVKDNNGFLHFPASYEPLDTHISDYALRVRRLSEVARSKGAKVLFVAAPSKYISQLVDIEEGYGISQGDDKREELIFRLAENGIDVLDLKPVLLDTGLSYEELFFKTDHHWRPTAAFEAFKAIIDKLNAEFDANLDRAQYYRDIDNYVVTNYDDAILGSMGRNTGVTFSGVEDFEFIYPKRSDMYFTWEYVNNNGAKHKKEGKTLESIYNLEKLNVVDKYSHTPYEVYLEEMKLYDRIRNRDNPEGPKILCIRDSYFSPVAAFMAPLFAEIEMVWPLAETHQQDIEKMVNDNTYDYVIIELYSYNINDAAFPYFKEGDTVK